MNTPQQLFCDNCGAAVRPGANYCGHCSAKLNSQHQFVPVQKTQRFTVPSILQNRYTIEKSIGSGGFGAVLKGYDTQLEIDVAIKQMISTASDPQEIIEEEQQFKNEAKMLVKLHHPALPRIYSYFKELDHWYIVMDYIEGETLEDMLNKYNPLPPTLVIKWIRQLCTVLTYLHNQKPSIIFRDLKPANIMLQDKDQEIKLIDFGIARSFKQGQKKDTTAYGSTGFAAPEQYGKAQSTPATDVYALGATLHTLLTNEDPSHNPFQFSSVYDKKEAWSKAMQDLLELMLKMKPEDRILLEFVDLALKHIEDTYPADPHMILFKDAITTNAQSASIVTWPPQNQAPARPSPPVYVPNAGKVVQSPPPKFNMNINQKVDVNPIWFLFNRKSDAEHVEAIQTQLKAMTRRSGPEYTIWENGDDMIPGTRILQEYQRRAEQTKIFVPLFSYSSVADDKFIDLVEKYAYSQVVYNMKLNQIILPIRVTQTDFDQTGANGVSILSRTAMPNDLDNPLRKLKAHDREQVYNMIAVRIKQILEGNI